MVGALTREMELQKKYLGGERLQTLYFGGGTPSLLSAAEIEILFTSVHNQFETNLEEVTLEANPDDLTGEKLVELRRSGVNRLSIGIQSFDDSILTFLHRAHNRRQAQACVAAAREAGFANLSVDLIYAIPGQGNAAWQKNIVEAIQLQPEHISAYTLTIEDKTVFGKWLKAGKFEAESDDTAAAQMEILVDMLGAAGYEQYEISNFCKPGFEAHHNSSYWQQKKYLGIGPSAHSFDGTTRQVNIPNNYRYIESIQRGVVPFELEVLTRANRINEYLLTSLRTRWGCDVDYLQQAFSYDLQKESEGTLRDLVHHGLAELHPPFIFLTKKGKLLADKIALSFFVADNA